MAKRGIGEYRAWCAVAAFKKGDYKQLTTPEAVWAADHLASRGELPTKSVQQLIGALNALGVRYVDFVKGEVVLKYQSLYRLAVNVLMDDTHQAHEFAEQLLVSCLDTAVLANSVYRAADSGGYELVRDPGDREKLLFVAAPLLNPRKWQRFVMRFRDYRELCEQLDQEVPPFVGNDEVQKMQSAITINDYVRVFNRSWISL